MLESTQTKALLALAERLPQADRDVLFAVLELLVQAQADRDLAIDLLKKTNATNAMLLATLEDDSDGITIQ